MEHKISLPFLQAAVAKHLAELAAQALTTTYIALAVKFGLSRTGLAARSHKLSKTLKAIQLTDMKAGRPSRTVVVTGIKSGLPGNGYYHLYCIDGEGDRTAIYQQHFALAVSYYGQVIYCETHIELPAPVLALEGPTYGLIRTERLAQVFAIGLPN